MNIVTVVFLVSNYRYSADRKTDDEYKKNHYEQCTVVVFIRKYFKEAKQNQKKTREKMKI